MRVTKRCLKKAIGQQRLTYEELLTILTEVEAVINNRPLTYNDEEDMDSLLTPSHLFCGRRTLDVPREREPANPCNLDAEDVVRRTRLVNTVIEHFWKRWEREYLLELRENHKILTKKGKADIQIGDVVLIHEDGIKRNKWTLGRIEAIIPGNDGVIRGAKIRTAQGHVQRPLQKLFPLEVTRSFCDKKIPDAITKGVKKPVTLEDGCHLKNSVDADYTVLKERKGVEETEDDQKTCNEEDMMMERKKGTQDPRGGGGPRE